MCNLRTVAVCVFGSERCDRIEMYSKALFTLSVRLSRQSELAQQEVKYVTITAFEDNNMSILCLQVFLLSSGKKCK